MAGCQSETLAGGSSLHPAISPPMRIADRAYSFLKVKTVDAETRSFSGMATTPELDRHGERIEISGVEFRNPLPLLAFHDQKQPIGTATFEEPSAEGIAFHAQMATVEEPGKLRDRLDEMWQSIKAGLITGVSIGFRPFEDGLKFLKDGTVVVTLCEVLELSILTIPANMNAAILSVKQLAALGRSTPGASGLPVVRVKDPRPMNQATTTEQITSYTAKRAANAERMLA